MSTSEFTPKLSYTSRDFATIKAELSDIVKQTRPEAWSDFFNSNLGVTLIELAALVGDMLSYNLDATGLESFLSSSRRYGSALRFAKSVGYTPRLSSAATVLMKSTTSLPDALVLNGGTIPAGSKISGQNGLAYELIDELAITPGTTVVRLVLRQGKTYSEEFAATAQQNQTVTTANGNVEDGSWDVYVGDPTNEANLWTQVENVDFETSPTNTYDVFFDDIGRLLVRFGNGTAGAIPGSLITTLYRGCDGEDGNAPVSSIRGSLKVNLASPGVGTVSVEIANRDDDVTSGGTQLYEDESQGVTAASTVQFGALANAPMTAGTAVLTFNLASGGGTVVLQDTGLGTFSVVTNTSAFTVSSSALTYSTGSWSVTFSGVQQAGGTILATYFAVVADSDGQDDALGAATGGADRESLSELKVNIPAYIRSQDKVLTLDDYNTTVRKLAGIALAFTDVYSASYSANFVKVNVWSSETVTFQSESADGSVGSSEYTRYTRVQQDRVNEVQAYLKSRTLLTVHNIILRPSMLWVDMSLGDIVYDKRLAADDVRQQVVENVVKVFEESGGFVVRLADVYNGVRDATGVRYFTIDRAATGARMSNELQGTTASTNTVSGTLLAPIISPQSVVVTVEQPTAMIQIKDNGAGGWTIVSGAATLSSGTIDYRTGAWTATFGSVLVPNQRVLADYDNVENDYRHDQIVTLDSPSDGDNWPPPDVTQSLPKATPPFTDGKPMSATRAGVTQTPPYLTGDVLTYAKLRDITVNAAVTSLHYFDESYQYNNEILYDSVLGATTDLRAINLRRLHFNLVPG